MTALNIAIDGRVINDHFPGIGRYTYHLIDALAEIDGDDVFTVLHTPGQTDSRYDLADLGRHGSVRFHPVDAPVFGLPAQWRLPQALRAVRADVFHATYWVSAYRPGRPTVLSLYDLIGTQTTGSIGGLRRLALEMAVRLAIRSADHLLTLSEASAHDLVTAAGIPADTITVTYLAADERFRPADGQSVADLRARLGLPEQFALYVGINKPHKNLSMLIDAWGRLARSGPDRFAPTSPTTPGAPQDGRTSTPGTTDDSSPFALVIAGRWDPRYSAIRDQAAALAGAADIRFLGSVDEADLPALYSSAAAFVFPSRYEGFGLPPLEAMSCGTPVIAAAASSLPEVMGDAGILVGPDDPAGWAEAMGRVLTDPSVAADLRARGLVRAAQFTWRETARKTLEVYRALAGQGLG